MHWSVIHSFQLDTPLHGRTGVIGGMAAIPVVGMAPRGGVFGARPLFTHDELRL